MTHIVECTRVKADVRNRVVVFSFRKGGAGVDFRVSFVELDSERSVDNLICRLFRSVSQISLVRRFD